MSEQAPPGPPEPPGSPGPATATKQKEKSGESRRSFGQILRESILEGNSVTVIFLAIFTAIVTSVFAGLIPLDAIAALANAGTLAAFIAVCAAMLVLRVREPNRERKFRAPAAWLVGIGGIMGCLYLFISLPQRTQIARVFVTSSATFPPVSLRSPR